jgi:galactitol-specific phosphotransferase system IIB component
VSGDAQSNDEVLERMTEQVTYQEPVSEPIISNVIENSSTMVEEKVEEMLEESNEDVVDVVETEESNSSVVMNQAPTTEAVESEVVVDSTEVKSTELQVEEPVSFEPKIEAKTVEKFEIDEEHYQAEMKRVIINNALAVADKGLLNTIVDSWKELVGFVGDETYGPIAHLLGEARVRVVGPGFIIVSYIHQAHVDRFYAQYSGVEDILAQILDEEFFIAAITEIEWVREKDNYITHKRRGEAYKEEALPSKDNYYKRIVVEEEKIEEQEIDAIVNDAIKLFGHDIVNVK